MASSRTTPSAGRGSARTSAIVARIPDAERLDERDEDAAPARQRSSSATPAPAIAVSIMSLAGPPATAMVRATMPMTTDGRPERRAERRPALAPAAALEALVERHERRRQDDAEDERHDDDRDLDGDRDDDGEQRRARPAAASSTGRADRARSGPAVAGLIARSDPTPRTDDRAARDGQRRRRRPGSPRTAR